VEGAFRHFGGVTEEVLLDNDRGLVARHDRLTREVEFNTRLHAFAKHWGFRPRACAPYRARAKGKDERGVGYVKKNAIAGRQFESWSALEAHLEEWTRDVADQRVHGTTGEAPIERFRRAEVGALSPIGGVPPFEMARELGRKVQADCVIEVDSNAYSVPWARTAGGITQIAVARSDSFATAYVTLVTASGPTIEDAAMAVAVLQTFTNLNQQALFAGTDSITLAYNQTKPSYVILELERVKLISPLEAQAARTAFNTLQ